MEMANNTENREKETQDLSQSEEKRILEEGIIEQKPTSFGKIAISRFFRHKLGIIGLILFIIFAGSAILAPQLAPHSITDQNLRNRFSPPTLTRIVPTGTAASANITINTMNNGEIFSRDLTFGIPSWYQNLEVGIVTPPAISHDTLFIGTDDNLLQARSLANGSEEWTVELDYAIDMVWGTADGVLVKGGNNFAHFSPDGRNFWEETVPGAIGKLTGTMERPLIITTDGDLLTFSVDGEEQHLASFSDAVPEMAFHKDGNLYFYSGGYVFNYDLTQEELNELGSLNEVTNQPLEMNMHGDKLFLGFSNGLSFGFDPEQGEKIWDRTDSGELIASRPGEQGRLETFWNNGRHRIINMETGGTTSSRMVQGFSDIHFLGTDELGRDVFSRILAGGRVSLALGIIVSIICVSVGTLVGATSGYFGGVVDSLIMRFVDFMLSIPALPMLMILTYLLGPSFETMIVALSILGWMSISRVVRSQTLSLKEQDFSQAARALGATNRRIIIRHIIPNTLAPVLVAMTLMVASAILSEAQLSYLGLGIQPPTPSWGNMLMNARQYLTTAPWLAVWPGLCIFLTLLSINFVGDAMRDALDPKLKGRD